MWRNVSLPLFVLEHRERQGWLGIPVSESLDLDSEHLHAVTFEVLGLCIEK